MAAMLVFPVAKFYAHSEMTIYSSPTAFRANTPYNTMVGKITVLRQVRNMLCMQMSISYFTF